MKALQAQINPHFLYNTLDAINWMALEYGAKKVSIMVNLLADFFRRSLKTSSNITTVEDEIDHVKVYLSIQKFRLEDSLTYNIEINKDIFKCPIITLIVQPLVENAIIHGIQMNPSQSGTINIKGYREDGNVIITIKDDGAGFDHIIDFENHVSTIDGNYGIHTSDQRIKLTFGEKYGLSYKSKPNIGTTVKIVLPGTYKANAPINDWMLKL